MERARPYLKVAAVVSAVALVGALVAYRAGAFSESVSAEPQPEPQPAAAPQTAPAPQPEPNTGQFIIMGGSKSDASFYPGRFPESGTPTNPPSPPPNAPKP